MYEDSWYNYTPDELVQTQPARLRTGSLLQQPVAKQPAESLQQQLVLVPEDEVLQRSPPEAEVPRRARSWYGKLSIAAADDDKIQDRLRLQLQQLPSSSSSRQRLSDSQIQEAKKRARAWQAICIPDSVADRQLGGAGHNKTSLDEPTQVPRHFNPALLEASQRHWLLYQDQLVLAERHLSTLVSDTDTALGILSSLASSFRAVDSQTLSFRARSEHLVTEQRRLEQLALDVGTDLHYYAYLDGASRRLNAPGAGRLVDDLEFAEMLTNLDACVGFMSSHPTYRDAESYLARYQALLTKALRLLEISFSAQLGKVATDVGREIAATKSDAARHALAYDRFADSVEGTFSLVPNVKSVCRRVYDAHGSRMTSKTTLATATLSLTATVNNPGLFVNTATNMFQTYLYTRDQCLKLVLQKEVGTLKSDAKGDNLDRAVRNYIKQSFERIVNERDLFVRFFGLDPMWTNDQESAYAAVKTPSMALVHPGSVVPLANNVQAVMQGANLDSICGIVGLLANEYLVNDSDYDGGDLDNADGETTLSRQSRQYAARLLTEHLWPFTDAAFEAEITKSITKAALSPEALKMGTMVEGSDSSNAYPSVKRALELLVQFDQAMPRERTQSNSTVVFRIVRETIQTLQRAEQKLRSAKTSDSTTDADLFMVKNLLVLKGQLVALEIGDIRTAPLPQSFASSSISMIWDATLAPTRWIGSIIGSGAALWSGGASASGGGISAKTLTVEDMAEQMDELLRQHIYAFSRRWGERFGGKSGRSEGTTTLTAATTSPPSSPLPSPRGPVLSGARTEAKAERELDGLLTAAFGTRSEVVARLKEAIGMHAQTEKK